MNQSELWQPSSRIEQAFTGAMRRLARRWAGLVKGIRNPGRLVEILGQYAKKQLSLSRPVPDVVY